jgi:hypothetical protein
MLYSTSRFFMYDFWYNHIKRKYPRDRAKLCYTDTDLFETEDIYWDSDLYDYPEDHPSNTWKTPARPMDKSPDGSCELKSKKVIGKWKDEFAET